MSRKEPKQDVVNYDILFYGWIGFFVVVVLILEGIFGKKYDENGREIK